MAERETPGRMVGGLILVRDTSFLQVLLVYAIVAHTVHTITLCTYRAKLRLVYSHMSGECVETRNTHFLCHLGAL